MLFLIACDHIDHSPDPVEVECLLPISKNIAKEVVIVQRGVTGHVSIGFICLTPKSLINTNILIVGAVHKL
jgi:hypothetical protein